MISIAKQSYKKFEVVLVDHPDTSDDTKKIAKRYKCRIFSKGPERSAQRNFGVKKSKGEFVVILDSDMVLGKNVLFQCVKEMEGKNKVSSVIIPEKSFGKGFWVKFKIFEREFYEGEELIEAARFFRRDVFTKFGGYDTSITGPEDYDLPLRMKKEGLKVGRSKDYIFHNEGKFSPWKSAKKKFYYASRAQSYLKKHPEMILKQGNLLFRPVFFKKWRKLFSNPALSLGMFLMKGVEMFGALLGFIMSGLIKKSFIKKVLKY